MRYLVCLALAASAYAQVPTIQWVNAQGFSTGGGTGLPSGLIVMLLSGSCPNGFAEVSALNGKMLRGTLAANGNVGTTGGNATITPSGSVSAPIFTGSASQTSADSAGTPSGTVSAPTFTGTSNQTTSAVSAGTPAGTNSTVPFTPSGSVAWPVGVPTFSGAAITDVINHTHVASVTDPGHFHSQAVNSATTGGLSGYTPDTSTNTSATSGYNTGSKTTGITVSNANPAGGVASITPTGTVAWPAGVPAFSGTSGTVPAETFTGLALGTHTHTLTPAGTNSMPTFSGSALGTHQHTLTPEGTVSQPSFVGDPIDPSPVYTNVIFCSKN